MSFAEELASRIASRKEFKSDLAMLETLNFRCDASLDEVDHAATLAAPVLGRLLQSAVILASSMADEHRALAQRISTATLRLSSCDESVSQLFAIVQGRLRNFPAISAVSTLDAPSYAPASLQLEFIGARERQTVSVAEREHVLTEFQANTWRALNAKASVTISAPTSAGKSYVVMLRLVHAFLLKSVKSVVYIVPTRALINQVAEDAAAEFAARAIKGVEVITVPVDMGDAATRGSLYVLTQERLDALLVANPTKSFDLVIVDEAQVIADGARGVLLESVIERVKLNSGGLCQFVFLGPLIKNPAYFGELITESDAAESTTILSPVTQRLIYLDYFADPISTAVVHVGERAHGTRLEFEVRPKLRTDQDRLSYLSYYFGRSGSSIVYANGKADSEKLALKLADLLLQDQTSDLSDDTTELADLIKLAKKHVHPDYALVKTLSAGVGFHYGHMPNLLRKELERCFKERKLRFMVCTSTLLYGLNLPAKNIFLQKPTTGKDTPIASAAFWNLAGRVGRLGKELEGQVFLIDYPEWSSSPAEGERGLEVRSALSSAVSDGAPALLGFIEDEALPSGAPGAHEVVLSKLLVDQREGRLNDVLRRHAGRTTEPLIEALETRIATLSASLEIPTDVLRRNVGVSPYRQRDLLSYFTGRLKSLDPLEVVPAHPLANFDEALNNYRRAFKRIHTHLLRLPGGNKSHNYYASLALRWMRGEPLPKLINASLAWDKKNGRNRKVATAIRDVMEEVEDALRFRYVRYFSAYNSLLKLALERTGRAEFISAVPDIPLFLEMGGSSGAMINLMALGLSRTSADEIAEYITDKDVDVAGARQWVARQDFRTMELSPAVAREVELLQQHLAAG